ncbi:hypothetical protein [Sulfobacillus harzensis]|nr:hypothetical protein [Sulfobacillus harzensis]
MNRPDVLRAPSTKPDLSSQIFPDADSRCRYAASPETKVLG